MQQVSFFCSHMHLVNPDVILLQCIVCQLFDRTLVSGTIPESWTSAANAFPRLQTLDLSSNAFTGALPAVWPPALQALNLTNTTLSGPLPAQLGSRTPLKILILHSNGFTGELPAQWGGPDAFQDLLVSAEALPS